MRTREKSFSARRHYIGFRRVLLSAATQVIEVPFVSNDEDEWIVICVSRAYDCPLDSDSGVYMPE